MEYQSSCHHTETSLFKCKMIKHILKRLSILNTYNTYVFDLVKKFVNARSIMKSCVSKRLTTAFNL